MFINCFFCILLWTVFVYQTSTSYKDSSLFSSKNILYFLFLKKIMAILFLDLKNISIATLHTFSRVPWSTNFGWQGLDPTFMLSSRTLSQLWPVFHVLQVDSQRIPLVFVLWGIKPVPLKSALIPTCREWQVLSLSLPRAVVLPGRGGSRICHQVVSAPRNERSAFSLPLPVPKSECAKQAILRTHYLRWNEFIFKFSSTHYWMHTTASFAVGHGGGVGEHRRLLRSGHSS